MKLSTICLILSKIFLSHALTTIDTYEKFMEHHHYGDFTEGNREDFDISPGVFIEFLKSCSEDQLKDSAELDSAMFVIRHGLDFDEIHDDPELRETSATTILDTRSENLINLCDRYGLKLIDDTLS